MNGLIGSLKYVSPKVVSFPACRYSSGHHCQGKNDGQDETGDDGGDGGVLAEGPSDQVGPGIAGPHAETVGALLALAQTSPT